MNIYSCDDYKDALQKLLEQKRTSGGRLYTYQKMATAAGIQKAYLSRVLNGDQHLSRDQLYDACLYLSIPKQERDFLLLLHAWQRAASRRYREELLEEIKERRRLSDKTEKQVPVTTYDDDEMAEFALDPVMQLVHLFLTVDTYAKDISLIATRLGISAERLLELIRKLESKNFIEFRDGSYHVTRMNVHLPRESKYYAINRVLVRMKMLERAQALPPDDTYNLAVFFSADPAVYERIRQSFFAFLKDAESLIRDAPSKQVYQMCFDLLPY